MVDLTTPTTTTYIAGGGITAASIIAFIYLYIYPKFLRGRDFLQNGNLIKGLCSIFAVSTILTSCELFAYENLISQQLQNLITKEINNNKSRYITSAQKINHKIWTSQNQREGYHRFDRSP